MQPTQKPIAELRVDGPILVIGGGPSVPSDLAELEGIEFAAVISANAHGFKTRYKPDFIYCGDHVHSETREPLGPIMRAYGVPILSHRPFADYLLPRDPVWRLNSGQGGIYAACLIGGSPVYPVGFDCWQGDATYFHDPDADVVCRRQGGKRIPQQLALLRKLTEGYDVRPVSGPLKVVPN